MQRCQPLRGQGRTAGYGILRWLEAQYETWSSMSKKTKLVWQWIDCRCVNVLGGIDWRDDCSHHDLLLKLRWNSSMVGSFSFRMSMLWWWSWFMGIWVSCAGTLDNKEDGVDRVTHVAAERETGVDACNANVLKDTFIKLYFCLLFQIFPKKSEKFSTFSTTFNTPQYKFDNFLGTYSLIYFLHPLSFKIPNRGSLVTWGSMHLHSLQF